MSAIGEHGLGKASVAFRMADFANLGKTIWAALDSDKAKNWDRILEKMPVAQNDFALGDNTVVPVTKEDD